MPGPVLVTILVVIVLSQILVWALLLGWLRSRLRRIAARMSDECRRTSEAIVIPPQSASYAGATARFGNVRGNGVICLTERRISFEKVTGQRIDIARNEIQRASVESSFRGRLARGTGALFLVLHMHDGNQVGFLVEDASRWSYEMRAG